MEFSVIIPVYNDEGELKSTLSALNSQTYPKELFEIIVVDNGSTDNSVELAKNYENTKVLIEDKIPGSPYSCRNRGIEIANGEYIILLDSTCIPTENWLSLFKKAFEGSNADIIGGKVSFRFSDKKPTAAEYYDSMTNIRMKKSIKEKGVAKTANLAFNRRVINKVGMFEEGRRSGGDLIWTQKAVSHGFKIDYSEKAEVFKKARKFNELLKKQWRVAKAQPEIWEEFGMKINYFVLFSRLIVGLGYSTIGCFYVLFNNIFRIRFNSSCKNEILGMAFIPYFIKSIMLIGNIYGYYQSRNK